MRSKYKKGTATGAGGFDIDGKNYTFDPQEVNNNGGDDPIDTSSISNDVDVDHSVKDISGKTKFTLGQFLSDLTEKNKFGVDKPTDPPTDTPITTVNEVPSPLAIGLHPNTEQFLKTLLDRPDVDKGLNLPVQPSQQTTLGIRLGPKIQDPIKEIEGNFSKGKHYPQNPDGNVVLSTHKGLDDKQTGPISSYIKAVLNNNRFSDASRSITGIGDGGISDPARGYNPVLRHPKYGDFRTHDLSKIGHALGIRASREINASDSGVNPTSAGAEFGAILPGSNQLALTKVPLKNLRVSDVLENLPRGSQLIDVGELDTQFDEFEGGRLISITDGINDGSWGALNNVHDRWTGITAFGMIALSIALVVGVTLVFGILSVIINAIGGSGKTHPQVGGRYSLGRYTITPNVSPSALDSITKLPPDFAALIGIRQTTYSFGQALEKGTLAFFGIKGSSFTSLLIGTLGAAVDNPGWNAIVARTIVRSSTQVIDAFANIGGNPISVVKGILDIVDVLRQSKLIAAMNTFANLGDQILTIDENAKKIPGTREIDELSGQLKISSMDATPNNTIQSNVRKSRMKGSIKLAWANNRSPSSYLIPDSLYTLAAVTKQLGSLETGFDTADPEGRNFTTIIEAGKEDGSKGRIPYDSDEGPSVVKMEKLLDAEYMPFYFHDLRTNEIISFQAFITSLTDDFAPAWEKTEGFGRVDQVRVYKNTARTISLSFIVASTSPKDFLDMWTKINKLVTLVYPGYTRGRVVEDVNKKNKFTQPFSQLIGSSPVIRLRLGDLLRSNNSRFALARLFGADQNVMTLKGETVSFKGGRAALVELAKIVAKATNPGDNYIYNNDFPPDWRWATHSNNLRKKPSPAGFAIPIPGASKEVTGSDVYNPLPAHAPFLPLKVVYQQGQVATNSYSDVVVQPELPWIFDLIKYHGMSQKTASELREELKNLYDNPDAPGSRLIGVKYLVPRSSLILTPASRQSFIDDKMSKASASADLLSPFLDPEKNALVKSFKAVGGKGLAGTIESLSFDYFENVPWETKALGSRAPQLLKVTMTFSPIHDISPGLDYNGFNRAPVYPVGYQSPSNDDMKEKK